MKNAAVEKLPGLEEVISIFELPEGDQWRLPDGKVSLKVTSQIYAPIRAIFCQQEPQWPMWRAGLKRFLQVQIEALALGDFLWEEDAAGPHYE